MSSNINVIRKILVTLMSKMSMVELDPKNVDVAKTLMNVYSALEMTAEYKELKAKIQ